MWFETWQTSYMHIHMRIYTHAHAQSGDMRHGRGTFREPHGDEYIGLWSQNKRHGHGTQVLNPSHVFMYLCMYVCMYVYVFVGSLRIWNITCGVYAYSHTFKWTSAKTIPGVRCSDYAHCHVRVDVK